MTDKEGRKEREQIMKQQANHTVTESTSISSQNISYIQVSVSNPLWVLF